MSEQILSSKIAGASRLPAATFLGVISACAMAAPLLLVVAAFSAFPDAVERAHFVVAGLRWSVLGLGAALALRAMFLLGEASAAAAGRSEPGLIAAGAAA